MSIAPHCVQANMTLTANTKPNTSSYWRREQGAKPGCKGGIFSDLNVFT